MGHEGSAAPPRGSRKPPMGSASVQGILRPSGVGSVAPKSADCTDLRPFPRAGRPSPVTYFGRPPPGFGLISPTVLGGTPKSWPTTNVPKRWHDVVATARRVLVRRRSPILWRRAVLFSLVRVSLPRLGVTSTKALIAPTHATPTCMTGGHPLDRTLLVLVCPVRSSVCDPLSRRAQTAFSRGSPRSP